MQQSGYTESTAQWTLEAWGALPEDEPGELVDGRLVEEEMATHIHETVVRFLLVLLSEWLMPRAGFVGGSNAKFKVSSSRGRKPDVYAYFAGRKLPPARAAVSEIPPDIVVEVVSSSPADARRDRVEKLREYASFGVRFYWLVDPEQRVFEILELSEKKRYEHSESASEGRIDRVPGCEGLVIDLDALWAEVDRWIAAAPD